MIFVGVVITSFMASYLVDQIGSSGMFSVFLACNAVAVLYIKLVVRDTQKDASGKLLNDK